jgi:hypothetical protein
LSFAWMTSITKTDIRSVCNVSEVTLTKCARKVDLIREKGCSQNVSPDRKLLTQLFQKLTQGWGFSLPSWSKHGTLLFERDVITCFWCVDIPVWPWDLHQVLRPFFQSRTFLLFDYLRQRKVKLFSLSSVLRGAAPRQKREYSWKFPVWNTSLRAIIFVDLSVIASKNCPCL